LNDVLKADADSLGFYDQLLDFLLQQPLAIPSTRFRWIRDNRANARMHLQPSLLNEVLHYLMGGVGMNLQLRRERTDRRK